MVGIFGVADLALGTVARVTMQRPWVAMASFVVVLLVLALGHHWSVTASWFTSDRTCRERHAAIAAACSARGCGNFMTKAGLVVHVVGRVLLTT